jgi:hypothetical protein
MSHVCSQIFHLFLLTELTLDYFIFVSKNTEIKSVEITGNEFSALRPLLSLRGPMMGRFHLDFMRNGLWDQY